MQLSMFDGKQKFKIDKPIRFIELFAGIGATTKALERLGIEFEHYRVVEIDKYAIKSYNAIHDTNFTTSDITKIHGEDLGVVDTDKYCYIMSYSFPCQDLSLAGKGAGMAKGSGTRSGLLWEVERLLQELYRGGRQLPQVLLLENVPGVIGKKNIRHFAEWVKFLDGLGYKSKWELLNAKDYGIPQNRNRCFMVSILGDYYYNFPQKVKLLTTLYDFVEFNSKYLLKTSKLYKTQRNCIKRLANTEVSKTIRASGASSYDRHLWKIYSVELRQSESFIKGKSLFLTNLSKTICVKHLNSYTIDGKLFYDYSPKEEYRLMGFNDEDFYYAAYGRDILIPLAKRVEKRDLSREEWKVLWRVMRHQQVSNSQLYRQAGNSIVVNVLEAIFREMF